MNNMHKGIYCLLAVLLAAFALPVAAADKLFVMTVTPSVIPQGPATTVKVVFTNQTPNGANSVINAVKVDVPPGVNYTVVGFQTVNGTSSSTAGTSSPPIGQSTNGGTTISVTNITGAKPKGTFTLTLSVTSTVSACTQVQWTGYANTGNTFNGSLFTDPNTNTLYSKASTYIGCTGVLGCGSGTNTGGDLDPTADNAFIGTPDWGLVRGPNTDGGTCALVPYTFNLAEDENIASFLAIKGDQDPSVEYVVLWDPVPVSGGFPTTQPLVSWGIANPVYNQPPAASPDYVPALACLSDNLNDPASIMPTIPDIEPYHSSAVPQYGPNQQAKMCVAQEGWTAIGNGMVQHWTKIIDQSDGYVKLP